MLRLSPAREPGLSGILRAGAALVILLAAPARQGYAAAAPGTTTISRFLSGRVYVEAGTNFGLQDGDTLRVVRAGRAIAALRIAFAGATRSSCDTLWTRDRLLIGDVARYAAAVPAPPASMTPAPVAATPGAAATAPVTATPGHAVAATPGPAATAPVAIARKPRRTPAPELIASPPVPSPPVTAPGEAVADTTPRRPALTKLTYVAGAEAFVEAGRLDGVRIGDTLTIVRAGRPVAGLRVKYAASKRASCDTLWTRGALALGDEVRYLSAPVRSMSVALSPPPASGPVMDAGTRQAGMRRQRIRGRVGARWLSVQTGGGRFQQPALDMRLDGTDVSGGHLDLTMDMRSRRTTRNFAGSSRQTDEFARVYRAALTVRSRDARHAVTIGRQNSPTLASISLFDGALARTGTARYTVGLFTGTQPDPEHYRFSPDVLQSGLFAEWHQAPLAQRRYSVAVGGVTSQQLGQPNRDFLFSQANWFSTRLMVSATQEVDVNRGWKRALGERTLSPTSTFGTMRWSVTRWVGVNTGFDNRRSVRLYRDRLTPETQFDDAYRQGTWVGGDAQAFQRLRIAGEVRGTGGADASRAWNWSAEAYRLGPVHAAVRARVSQYDGTTVKSRLTSGSIGFDPWPLSHIEAAGGARRTRVEPATSADTEWWQSVDIDMTLARRWYLNAGWEHDYGGASGDTRQLQAGLSWRF